MSSLIANAVAPQQRERDPEIAKRPAYISYCRVCGGMTGCCAADESNCASAAEFAREVIAAKQILERETAAEVWAGQWCICHEVAPGLFDAQEII
jgi:hypothetical protein